MATEIVFTANDEEEDDTKLAPIIIPKKIKTNPQRHSHSPSPSPSPSEKEKKNKRPTSVSYRNVVLHVILTCILGLYITDIYWILSYQYKHQQGEQIIYPLRNGTFNTTTAVATAHETVFNQLRLNLLQRPRFIVLCMHHLKLPTIATIYYPLCTLYNKKRSEFIHMIEPRLIGSTRATRLYTENSVSCPTSYTKERYDQVVIEWTSLRNQTLYSVFNMNDSVALQLALDELKGNKHC
jgi:hypothetical protein